MLRHSRVCGIVD